MPVSADIALKNAMQSTWNPSSLSHGAKLSSFEYLGSAHGHRAGMKKAADRSAA
jgi:hypothetical protein